MKRPEHCLIVGAGMAGLMAAHKLQAHGLNVSVFDKGRSVGGRMATRWIELEAGKKGFFDLGDFIDDTNAPIDCSLDDSDLRFGC